MPHECKFHHDLAAFQSAPQPQRKTLCCHVPVIIRDDYKPCQGRARGSDPTHRPGLPRHLKPTSGSACQRAHHAAGQSRKGLSWAVTNAVKYAGLAPSQRHAAHRRPTPPVEVFCCVWACLCCWLPPRHTLCRVPRHMQHPAKSAYAHTTATVNATRLECPPPSRP